MPKGSKNKGEAQDKQGRLVRLANKRVPRAVKAIALIGNLASYKPTENQTKYILTALSEALETVKARFAGTKQEEKSFTLPG